MPIQQVDEAAAVLGVLRGVGYYDDSGAVFMQTGQDLHDLITMDRVKVSRRLVGQDELWFGHHCPGYRHPLLLAAGELLGEMALAVPLRERMEDIPLLVEHFIRQYAQKYKHHAKHISSVAMEKLRLYHWPGNVRELKHAIERAIILSESATLDPDDFPLPSDKSRGQDSFQDNLKLEDVERGVIEKVLHDHDGNVSRAARALGLTRASLYRRMKKYGL